MKSMRLFVLLLVAFSLLVPAMASGQVANPPAGTKTGSGTVEQEIKTLQGQIQQAILKGDTIVLEKYYADDYTAIHGNGTLSTKAQEIESFKSSATKYDSITVREAKIRIYGDTVVVNALASVIATFNGNQYNGDVRNTRVWVKRDGNWKLVLFEATRVAPATQ
ncbi:MAG: nuclear transport factor 2 family protein [Terriglobia bacterium]